MFYVVRKNEVTRGWSTVCGYNRYEAAEQFIGDMLNRRPSTYKIEKVYERHE